MQAKNPVTVTKAEVQADMASLSVVFKDSTP